MELDDYESLPTGSAVTHMAAGAAAGIMEHCVMYPLDSVKTRMQSLRPSPGARYRSIADAFYKMVRHEGVMRPVRGMSAVVIGAGPAHALYFSCYEKLKRTISGTEHGTNSPISQGLAGCLATVMHDGIMNPAEVVKQRMQMYNSQFKRCSECFLHVWRQEGGHAFYRSFTTQLSMNIPFQCVHFVTYEFMQVLTNKERVYNPVAHMVSGGIAGAFAAAVTTPLDVCKTLLNTQESSLLRTSHQPQISGLVNAAATIYSCCGFKGYFRGLSARVLFQMPATAISWSVYEFFKSSLNRRNSGESELGPATGVNTAVTGVSTARPSVETATSKR
ncbi:putative carrier protein MRS3/4 [Ixodes scapularis]